MPATQTNPLRVGLRQERVIAPQCLVIFGASGDLTHRKLIPALFELFRQRRLPSEFAVLGCARRPWSDDDFRNRMAEGSLTPQEIATFEAENIARQQDMEKSMDRMVNTLIDRKSTRLNSSHSQQSRMPSSA